MESPPHLILFSVSPHLLVVPAGEDFEAGSHDPLEIVKRNVHETPSSQHFHQLLRYVARYRFHQPQRTLFMREMGERWTVGMKVRI